LLATVLTAGSTGCSLRDLDDLEPPKGSPRAQPCPDEMQEISSPDGSTFCIDRRETTRLEFDEFVRTGSLAPVPPVRASDPCNGLELEPRGGADCTSPYETDLDPDLPVTCVDSCEARAYCLFRGKRLCGGPGGVLEGRSGNDEWSLACRGPERWPYPYGMDYEEGRCNINTGAIAPVGSFPECSTPTQIMDLSGNVSEWVLVCGLLAGDIVCAVRGGEYLTPSSTHARCDPNRGDPDPQPRIRRNALAHDPDVGIRCCHD
jgi:formylglycine-generating enzyme required for sulfatase activity